MTYINEVTLLAIDAKEDKDKFNILYQKMLKYFRAYFIANYRKNNFSNSHYQDDLESELYFQLEDAVGAFKIEMGASFQTYIRFYFKKLCVTVLPNLKNGLNEYQRRNELVFLTSRDSIKPGDGNLSADDSIIGGFNYSQVEDTINLEYNKELIEKLFDGLSERNRFIAEKHYENELTCDEIARLIFKNKLTNKLLTRSRIQQIISDIELKVEANKKIIANNSIKKVRN